jgi:hypothetical protein
MKHKNSGWLRWSTLLVLLGLITSGPSLAATSVSKIDIGLPNTIVFLINGEFDGNEILRFKAAVAEVPATVRIVAALDSPGGLIYQGLELGNFFTTAKIPTIVLAGQSCASACTFAFFGGRDPLTNKPLRIMVEGAKLGFHNARGVGEKKGTEPTYTRKELENLSHMHQQLVYAQLKFFK